MLQALNAQYDRKTIYSFLANKNKIQFIRLHRERVSDTPIVSITGEITLVHAKVEADKDPGIDDHGATADLDQAKRKKATPNVKLLPAVGVKCLFLFLQVGDCNFTSGTFVFVSVCKFVCLWMQTICVSILRAMLFVSLFC